MGTDSTPPEVPRPDAPSTRRILIVTDPGVTARHVAALTTPLESEFSASTGAPVEISHEITLIPLTPDDTIDYFRARATIADSGPDAILMVTEIPRYTTTPLVAEVFRDDLLAVVSLPTVGAWRTRRRLGAVLTACATLLLTDQSDESQLPAAPWRWSRWQWRKSTSSLTLLSAKRLPWLRTALGMTVANQPWRTAPRLSGALATAAGAGAFGIFYNSIWQMAEFLPTWRMLLIALFAVVALMGWLVMSNGLWERTTQTRFARITVVYNMSTLATLLLCVGALYAILFLSILAGSLALIDPAYMAVVLGRPVGLGDYLKLALLSSTMGVVAGALGSNFDSGTDLRQLTHGRRETLRVIREDG